MLRSKCHKGTTGSRELCFSGRAAEGRTQPPVKEVWLLPVEGQLIHCRYGGGRLVSMYRPDAAREERLDILRDWDA